MNKRIIIIIIIIIIYFFTSFFSLFLFFFFFFFFQSIVFIYLAIYFFLPLFYFSLGLAYCVSTAIQVFLLTSKFNINIYLSILLKIFFDFTLKILTDVNFILAKNTFTQLLSCTCATEVGHSGQLGLTSDSYVQPHVLLRMRYSK